MQAIIVRPGTGAFGISHLISSSGHLALLQYFFGVDAEQVLPFAGSLCILARSISVFIVYWNDIVELVKGLGAVIDRYFHGKGTACYCNPNQTAWIHDHRGDHTDGDHRSRRVFN